MFDKITADEDSTLVTSFKFLDWGPAGQGLKAVEGSELTSALLMAAKLDSTPPTAHGLKLLNTHLSVQGLNAIADYLHKNKLLNVVYKDKRAWAK